MQQHFVYCGDEGIISQQHKQKYGLFLWKSTTKKKNLTLMGNPSLRRPRSTPPSLNYWPRKVRGVFRRFSITARLRPITTDSGQRTWRMIGCVSVTPPAQSARGRVDEIAGQIMLLADASLITALLSISNYTGCLAEREGRWTSYWKSLYWQYSHQAVMASPPHHHHPTLKQPLFFFPAGSSLPAAQAGFHFSCLIRDYFTPGMQSECN